MATATKTTATQAAPADRKLRLVYSFVSDGTLVLGLVIVQGKRHDGYTVRATPHDLGCDVVWEREDTHDVYRVQLSAGGTSLGCSCPGNRFHHHCKHADAAETLAARGLVPAHA